MRKDADIHTFGGADQTVKIASEGTLSPAFTCFVADENLRAGTMACQL